MIVVAGAVLVASALVAAILCLDALAFMILWRWFVAPVFGLPLLNVAQALGLGITVSLVAQNLDTRKPADDEHQLLKHFLRPAMALAVGAIVRLFL